MYLMFIYTGTVLCFYCDSVFVHLYIVLSMNLEDITTIVLGLAVFLQWCGLLRFLSYFDTYNVSSGEIYYVGYYSRYIWCI